MTKRGTAGIVDYGEVVMLPDGNMAVVGLYGTLFWAWESAICGFDKDEGNMGEMESLNLNIIIHKKEPREYYKSWAVFRKDMDLLPEQEELIESRFQMLR